MEVADTFIGGLMTGTQWFVTNLFDGWIYPNSLWGLVNNGIPDKQNG